MSTMSPFTPKYPSARTCSASEVCFLFCAGATRRVCGGLGIHNAKLVAISFHYLLNFLCKTKGANFRHWTCWLHQHRKKRSLFENKVKLRWITQTCRSISYMAEMMGKWKIFRVEQCVLLTCFSRKSFSNGIECEHTHTNTHRSPS